MCFGKHFLLNLKILIEIVERSVGEDKFEILM
jgi:hypothetical protein